MMHLLALLRRIRRIGLWSALAIGGLSALALTTLELQGQAGEFPRGLLDHRDQSVRVLARDGSLLREALSTDGEVRARWVPLHEVSAKVIGALLAAEDAGFMAHRGVDYRALARAAWYQLTGRRSGGSTLSQQVVKLLLRRPRTLGTKWNEMVMALRLERMASKEEILFQYLNRAPFGTQEVGIEAGAQALFNKPAREVSLAEAALLAGLPKSPVGYDPRRNPRSAVARRDWVLGRMAHLGLISKFAAEAAKAEPLALAAQAKRFDAPHFAVQALRERGGAAVVNTSIVPRLQRQAEALVRRAVDTLAARGGSQASAIVLENATGEVLAYVGSADWHDPGEGQTDAVRTRRQPGSALKPFAYALGFEGELSPASLLADLPAHFTTRGGEYSPRNYDARFHGPVLAREALANSYNVPAVRVAHALSPGAFLARLRSCGFDGLAQDEDHYGLGLVLGNGEVTLWELARAYLMLARGGERIEPVVARRTGAPPQPMGHRVFSRQAAYLVSQILSDRHARRAAFGEFSALDLPFTAAVKTGTSTDFRDNWTAGFTSEVTVAVWVGNFSGKPMRNVSGVTGAAPLWNELMEAAMEGRPRRGFEEPPGIAHARVCARSGKLAGRGCTHGRLETFRADRTPRERCDVHVEVRVDSRTGLRAGPGCPLRETKLVRGEHYGPELAQWAAEAGRPLVPREYSPRCPAPITAQAPVRVQIRSPRDGDVLALTPDLPRRAQRMRLEAVVDGAPSRLRWLIDGREVSIASFPYQGRWQLEPGEHELVAEADGVASDPVTVTVRP